jgi:hypothetical protein
VARKGSRTSAGDGGAATATETESKTSFAIGNLPDDIKTALLLKRQQNIVAAEIAGTNWGKGLDRETRRAIADWSRTVDLDPATELDVLGGRFYKNAQYYQRKLSEAVNAGYIDYVILDHVEVDDRLETMAKRVDDPELAQMARKEIDRRTMMRVQMRIPDKAEAAVICRVKVKGIHIEFLGAKWCGGGTRQKDPVGDAFPVETAETRSIRRTMRLIAERKKDLPLAQLVEKNDDDHIDEEIGGVLRDGLARAHKDAEQAMRMARGTPLMALPQGDPYSTGAMPTSMPKREREKVPASGPVSSGAPPAKEGAEPPIPDSSTSTSTPQMHEDFQNDLELLSPEERAEYDRLKREDDERLRAKQ